jgi:hypothetical protein
VTVPAAQPESLIPRFDIQLAYQDEPTLIANEVLQAADLPGADPNHHVRRHPHLRCRLLCEAHPDGDQHAPHLPPQPSVPATVPRKRLSIRQLVLSQLGAEQAGST